MFDVRWARAVRPVRRSARVVKPRGMLPLLSTAAFVHLAYSWVLRPWHLEWGATAGEVRRSMPGDELVPHPTLCATRGITIDASPAEIWPWLVQMGGYTRAGWYSYDRFDNAGVPSADHICPQLQDLEVGDVMLTSRTAGFTVDAIDPGRSLVLVIDRNGSRISSVPMLVPQPDGRTRLVFRVRAYFRPSHRWFALAFDVGDFVFMRKQMLGIRCRVEHQRQTARECSQRGIGEPAS